MPGTSLMRSSLQKQRACRPQIISNENVVLACGQGLQPSSYGLFELDANCNLAQADHGWDVNVLALAFGLANVRQAR